MTKVNAKKAPVKKTDDFVEDDGDKRLIVFVAVAVLVIIGTIIGLLVGCQKKEEQTTDEPKKDTVVPVEKDEDEEKDEEETTDVVKKVTSTVTTESNKSYEVVFYYNDFENTFIKNVKEGNKVTPYVPDGYESCKYYSESNFSKEFDFSTKINGSTNIYMDCSVIEYSIIYDVASANPTSYTVNSGNIDLTNIESENIFVGWYSNLTFTNKVTKLTPSIIELANSKNEIHLYARIETSLDVNYYNKENVKVETKEYTKNGLSSVVVESGSNNYCSSDENFLGWSKTSGSMKINNNAGDIITLTDDVNYYAVCGKAKVVYASEGEVVEEVGYTKEDLEDYDLPDAEDLDMEVPTYFVPVETETETSKKIVSDDVTEVGEKEIKLQDVIDKKAEGYTPSVNDNVEEKDKVLAGWTTEDTDPESETVGEQVPVPDDYVPQENTDTTLNAVWEEQPVIVPDTSQA